MERDLLGEFEASLIGRACSVTRHECGFWGLAFGDGIGLMIGDPWRIVADGSIAFSSADDGDLFGLERPLDGECEARRLLAESPIVGASVDRQTGDLTLRFESGARIDVFRNSSAYEGWTAGWVINGEQWMVIALGGGEVTFMLDENKPIQQFHRSERRGTRSTTSGRP